MREGERSWGRCQTGEGITVGDDRFYDIEPDHASAKLDCETVQFSHTAIPAPHDGGI